MTIEPKVMTRYLTSIWVLYYTVRTMESIGVPKELTEKFMSIHAELNAHAMESPLYDDLNLHMEQGLEQFMPSLIEPAEDCNRDRRLRDSLINNKEETFGKIIGVSLQLMKAFPSRGYGAFNVPSTLIQKILDASSEYAMWMKDITSEDKNAKELVDGLFPVSKP